MNISIASQKKVWIVKDTHMNNVSFTIGVFETREEAELWASEQRSAYPNSEITVASTAMYHGVTRPSTYWYATVDANDFFVQSIVKERSSHDKCSRHCVNTKMYQTEPHDSSVRVYVEAYTEFEAKVKAIQRVKEVVMTLGRVEVTRKDASEGAPL